MAPQRAWSQVCTGVRAARARTSRVPRQQGMQRSYWVCRVPRALLCAELRRSFVMSKRDDNAFRLRPTAPKTRDRQFLSRVLREVSKAGGKALKLTRSSAARTGARLGRGHVAAGVGW